MTLTDSNAKPLSGTCTSMTITSYYDSTTNATSYLIVCPYEENHMVNYLNTLVTLLELSGMK